MFRYLLKMFGASRFAPVFSASIARSILVVFSVLLFPAEDAAAQSGSPNIVFILADDLGYGDVGAYGATDIFTPNIDRLAIEGVKLERFYMAPSCSISRSMLLTGSYAPRNSLGRNHTPSAATGIHDDEITLGELLQGVGYSTGLFGKWHLGDHYQFLPRRHGFDRFYGIPYSNNMWPFHPRTAVTPGEDPRLTAARQRAQQTGYASSNRSFPPGEGYPNLPLYDDDIILEFNPDQAMFGTSFIDATLAFIEANASGPFFAYVPLSAPHVPLHPGAAVIGTSARGLYGDTVQEIDAGVGRILDKITELAIDNETLVIFTSDNGPWLEYGIDGGSAGSLNGGKEGQFEGGIRVPALLRWPGHLTSGTVIAEPVSAADVFPTLANLTGAAIPADRVLDGVDIWELLTGSVSSVSRETFFGFNEGDFAEIDLGAIVSGSWKLHVRPSSGSIAAKALYDLSDDPGEATDEKGSESAVVASLLAEGRAIVANIAANQRPLGVVTHNGDPFSERPGVGDLIVMEAENFHFRSARSGHDWTPLSLRHSSAERSLTASPNNGANLNGNYAKNSPHLGYRFIAEQAGTYYVWVRARGASNDDDSLHIGLDGQAIATGKRIVGIDSVWGWTSIRSDGSRAMVDLNAPGEYVLDAWMREDGVIVDKFVLTTDENFVPKGKGPVESRQSYDSLNLPPIAVDDGPYFVDEGETLAELFNVLDNDIDPRGDPRTAELVDPPQFSSDFVLRPDGTFDYSHNGTESSSDSFSYRAVDVDGASNVATVMIDINNSNDRPEITLIGDAELLLHIGDVYVEPGVTATDEEDGDITGDVIMGGDTVDTSVAGSYGVTYDVSDSEGTPAEQVVRIVTVSARSVPPPPPPRPVSSGGGGLSLSLLVLLLFAAIVCRQRRCAPVRLQSQS